MPREDGLRTLAGTIQRRLLGLMKRRGMLRKETLSNAEQQLGALAACGTQGPWRPRGPVRC